MRAVVLTRFGDVNQLELQEVEDPPVGAGEVRVKMHATSINPVDWKIRSGATKGRIDVELPAILGRDLSGVVEKTGEGVTGFLPGQRVMALANGTYAELTTAKADVLAPVPESLNFEQAAALPLVTLTGAQLIERAIKLQPGQTVLVLGALGGVGRSAVHVALKRGAHVLAGVRATQTEEAAGLGAQRVIAIDDEKEMEKLHELDAVADTVGGPTAAHALKTLKQNGVFGSVLGAPGEVAQHNIRVATFMAEPDASRLYQLAEDAARGEFRIPIAKILPLEKIREAQQEAESHSVAGKIIVRIS